MSLYPSLPGSGPSQSYGYGYSNAAPQRQSYPPPQQGMPPPPQQHEQSLPADVWSSETGSTLRVKVADEYRLDPPVQVPPALEAVARPHQDVDFDYERKVMQEEAASSVDAFVAKPEEAHLKDHRAGKFVSMGFSVPAVLLALAYQSSIGGDRDSQVVDFCNNYTQLLGMGFGPAVAAGALAKTHNDLSAATEMCLGEA